MRPLETAPLSEIAALRAASSGDTTASGSVEVVDPVGAGVGSVVVPTVTVVVVDAAVDAGEVVGAPAGSVVAGTAPPPHAATRVATAAIMAKRRVMVLLLSIVDSSAESLDSLSPAISNRDP
jgi:hypothetical protein